MQFYYVYLYTPGICRYIYIYLIILYNIVFPHFSPSLPASTDCRCESPRYGSIAGRRGGRGKAEPPGHLRQQEGGATGLLRQQEERGVGQAGPGEGQAGRRGRGRGASVTYIYKVQI